MPLVLSAAAVSAKGNLIIHELQGSTYKDFTCTRCGTTYQRVRLAGAADYAERPCPRCSSTNVHLRAIPTGHRVPGSDLDQDRLTA